MGVWKLLARKMVGGAGKAIEKALFGDLDEVDAPPKETPADPFAKLKAAEAEKKRREREGK
jgi:hypothetical protein